ncbi:MULTISPECIES: PA2928 family protein [unclassified Enterococcus]|uniref:PA2928 family protein n=1 Tax=unclassified Enterococcus TaxID=2608891 RepID=UPI001CE06AA5|nr:MULTISPECIES: PA2928 family protein [unclassified Enterococcus]MCA5013371.1 hypothetical protein [Enterococcus sp. S23]MCA5016621.1 hypothetical protein [Enterococcus sp. S22(2020)]
MQAFLTSWMNLFRYTDSVVHNGLLTLFYGWSIFYFTRLFIDLGKDLKLKRVSLKRRIPQLISVFIINVLLGSFLLALLQPSFFKKWQFNGWLFNDVMLGIIYGVIVVTFIFMLRSLFKKNKAGVKKSIQIYTMVFIVEFLVATFVMAVFAGAFSRIVFEQDAQTIVTKNKAGNTISINKIRQRIPNGRSSSGISTSMTYFLISAVDLKTGETTWTKHSKWQEYLIGSTKEGLFTVDSKKERVYFIDETTGKVSLTEQEWIEKIPELKDNLSYQQTDYAIIDESSIYFYGLDGRYYKVDLKTKEVIQNPDYEKIVDQHNGFMKEHWNSLDTQKELAALGKLYPEFLDLEVEPSMNEQDMAFVVYKAKRNSKEKIVAKVSLEKAQIFWRTVLEQEADDEEPVMLFKENNAVYAVTGRKQYKIDEQNGQLLYLYDYQYNERQK